MGKLQLSTYASLVEQLADLWHGEGSLAHLELAPLACHGQYGVACDAGQNETVQWWRDQFLFCR